MKELKNKIELIIDSEQKCNRETILDNNLDNLFVFDDKNIYYDLLKDKIKNIKVLNLKELENSVSWNPLTYPYHLYKNGDIDNAIELINKIGFYIFNEPNENIDLFWVYTTSDYLTALTIHLFEEENDIKNINMTNILELSNKFEKGLLDEYYSKLNNKSLEYNLISATLNAPIDTKLSILSVFKQRIKIIITRSNLMEILSNDDIKLDKLSFENKDQCIIVVGNPKLNTIANIFINQLYKVLEKSKSKEKINIILDSLDAIYIIGELESLLLYENNFKLNLIATTKSKEILINRYGENIMALFKKNKPIYGQMMTFPIKIAKKDLFTITPMPLETESFTLDKKLTEEDIFALKFGIIPESSDDRWLCYVENNKLYIHRSWSGNCIYIVELNTNGHLKVIVNRNPEQYTCIDIEEDIEIVSNLLNYWKINKYIQDNLVMEELYKTILKREEIVDKVVKDIIVYPNNKEFKISQFIKEFNLDISEKNYITKLIFDELNIKDIKVNSLHNGSYFLYSYDIPYIKNTKKVEELLIENSKLKKQNNLLMEIIAFDQSLKDIDID